MNQGMFEKMALVPKIKVPNDCGNSGTTGLSCPWWLLHSGSPHPPVPFEKVDTVVMFSKVPAFEK